MSVHTLSAARPNRLETEDPAGRNLQNPANAEPFDESRRLQPARGIAIGLLISVPFWLLVMAGLWFWL